MPDADKTVPIEPQQPATLKAAVTPTEELHPPHPVDKPRTLVTAEAQPEDTVPLRGVPTSPAPAARPPLPGTDAPPSPPRPNLYAVKPYEEPASANSAPTERASASPEPRQTALRGLPIDRRVYPLVGLLLVVGFVAVLVLRMMGQGRSPHSTGAVSPPVTAARWVFPPVRTNSDQVLLRIYNPAAQPTVVWVTRYGHVTVPGVRIPSHAEALVGLPSATRGAAVTVHATTRITVRRVVTWNTTIFTAAGHPLQGVKG